MNKDYSYVIFTRYLISVNVSMFPRLPPIGFILNRISFSGLSHGIAYNLSILLCPREFLCVCFSENIS